MPKMWKVSIALFLALVALLFFWIIPYLIRQQINLTVERQSVRWEYGDLAINLLSGRAIFRELEISLHQNLLQRGLVKSTADQAIVSGISWWSLIQKKEMKASSVKISQPVIKLVLDTISSYVNPASRDTQKIVILVDEVIVEGAKLSVVDHADSLQKFTVASLDITIADLVYGKSDMPNDMSRSLAFHASDVVMRDNKYLYDVQLKSVEGHSQDSTFIIKEISGVPRYDVVEFSRVVKEQTDRIEFDISEIRAVGMDILGMFEKRFVARNLSLFHFTIEDFLDKNLPHYRDHLHPLPQEFLRRLNYDIYIDSITLKDGYIAYAELLPGQSKAGAVMFNNVNGYFTNVTNDSLRWLVNDEIQMKLECLLYGDGPTLLTGRFPMLEKGADFYYSGRLGSFDITRANETLAPSTQMLFTDGEIDEMSFQVHANSSVAYGNMQFYYRDLDIEFQQTKFIEGIVNNLVEAFAFPQENLPTEKHNLGKIYAKREYNKSLFNYLWISVLSGIKSTIMPNLVLPPELKHERVDALEE